MQLEATLLLQAREFKELNISRHFQSPETVQERGGLEFEPERQEDC